LLSTCVGHIREVAQPVPFLQTNLWNANQSLVSSAIRSFTTSSPCAAVSKKKLAISRGGKGRFIWTKDRRSKLRANPRPRLKVILLEDVERIGMKGDVVPVKRGRARLDLLPNRLADYATEENMIKYGVEEKAKDSTGTAVPLNVVKYLKSKTFEMTLKNGGMISRHDIAFYFSKRHYMHVPVHVMNVVDNEEDVIYSAGDHTVEITINRTVTVPITLSVVEESISSEETAETV